MRHQVNDKGVMGRRFGRRGLSLIELLIVASLLSIFSVIVLTRWEMGVYEQARSAAEVVASDIAYTRNLAVANNSSYRLTFDVPNDRYVLTHAGSSPILDTLPSSPYGTPSDGPHERTTDLTELPIVNGVVRLVAVQRLTPAAEDTTELVFGALGEVDTGVPTRIWLAVGDGDARRFLWVEVHPVTGLTSIGELQSSGPTSSASAGGPG